MKPATIEWFVSTTGQSENIMKGVSGPSSIGIGAMKDGRYCISIRVSENCFVKFPEAIKVYGKLVPVRVTRNFKQPSAF